MPSQATVEPASLSIKDLEVLLTTTSFKKTLDKWESPRSRSGETSWGTSLRSQTLVQKTLMVIRPTMTLAPDPSLRTWSRAQSLILETKLVWQLRSPMITNTWLMRDHNQPSSWETLNRLRAPSQLPRQFLSLTSRWASSSCLVLIHLFRWNPTDNLSLLPTSLPPRSQNKK